MTCLRVLGIVILLASPWAGTARAQQLPSAPQLPTAAEGAPDERPQVDEETVHKMQIAQQKKRYESIQQDAAKLLEVATELKRYVDKAGKDVLSLEVVRKAEEMEKLARQIKTNMRSE